MIARLCWLDACLFTVYRVRVLIMVRGLEGEEEDERRGELELMLKILDIEQLLFC